MKPRFAGGKCRQCEATYVLDRKAFSGMTDAFCTPYCCRRYHKEVRVARKRLVEVGIVRRRAVYERDDWICQLCHKQVPRDKRVPHPMSATLDHIIPLALNGPHVMDNLQLAHFICNSRKRHLSRSTGGPPPG